MNQLSAIPKFSRHWAMPCADTFECKPVRAFVERWMDGSKVSVDPFARNNHFATYRNDLNPSTSADYHLDAREFLNWMAASMVRADRLLLDPPYSPRQISECYAELGVPCGMEDTQNGRFYKEVRDAGVRLLAPGAVVLSFGWNSSGMGQPRGFQLEEIMLVCHGGAHNDTICIAERQIQSDLFTPSAPPSQT